jgi:hypothetical protein
LLRTALHKRAVDRAAKKNVPGNSGVIFSARPGAASVKSGGTITGSVAELAGRNIELVLVTDNGSVYNQTGRGRR